MYAGDRSYELREVTSGWAVDLKQLQLIKVTCYEYNDYKTPAKLIWYKSTGSELDPAYFKLFSSYDAAKEWAINHWTIEVKQLLNAIERLAKPKPEIAPKTT